MNRNKSNLKIKIVNKDKVIKKQIIKQRNLSNKQKLTNVDLVIGIDNGATGTMCSWDVQNGLMDFIQTPSKRQLNYQQQITYIDRLDHILFKQWLKKQINDIQLVYNRQIKVIIVIQRPMVNPSRFDSSINAVRVFQSTLVILQQMTIDYIVIDSKKWQHYFFGKDTSFIDLKFQSLKKGIQIIENNKYVNKIKEVIIKHGDADAMLITKFAIEKLIKR